MEEGNDERGAEGQGGRAGFTARNFSKIFTPIQPKKRVGQLRDVAFEKVEDTKSFLQEIDSDVRARLVQEYNKKLQAIAPDLRNMGKATGDQMLSTLLIPMNDPVEKKWRESLGYVGIAPEMTQMVIRPILQPFCDGLWEPFDGFIGEFKQSLYIYACASAVAGLVTGYLIGSFRSKKS